MLIYLLHTVFVNGIVSKRSAPHVVFIVMCIKDMLRCKRGFNQWPWNSTDVVQSAVQFLHTTTPHTDQHTNAFTEASVKVTGSLSSPGAKQNFCWHLNLLWPPNYVWFCHFHLSCKFTVNGDWSGGKQLRFKGLAQLTSRLWICKSEPQGWGEFVRCGWKKLVCLGSRRYEEKRSFDLWFQVFYFTCPSEEKHWVLTSY